MLFFSKKNNISKIFQMPICLSGQAFWPPLSEFPPDGGRDGGGDAGGVSFLMASRRWLSIAPLLAALAAWLGNPRPALSLWRAVMLARSILTSPCAFVPPVAFTPEAVAVPALFAEVEPLPSCCPPWITLLFTVRLSAVAGGVFELS